MPSTATRPGTTPPLPTRGTALFLDLDGTVLELADTPSAVVVDPSLRATIAELAGLLDGALAMVSGRAIADLDRILAPLTLPAAGQHGLEWRGVDGARHHHPASALPAGILAELEQFAADHPGTIFERKGGSFALHFRRRPDAEQAVTRCVAAAADAAGRGWEVLQGKMMAELRPAGVHKGKGIRHLLALPPFTGRRPTFLGDDWTDEDGFRTVNELGGCSIAVGVERATIAQFRLDGVAAVHDWLRRAVQALRPAREHA